MRYDATVGCRGRGQEIGAMGVDHLFRGAAVSRKGERNDIVSTAEIIFGVILLAVILVFSQGVRRVIFLVIFGILVLAKLSGF